jgi:hypothetical protein
VNRLVDVGSETFQKRERERKRQERAALKSERREARRADTDEAPVSTDELMEEFRILSEQHACGAVDTETYEAARAAIFEQLGVNNPNG